MKRSLIAGLLLLTFSARADIVMPAPDAEKKPAKKEAKKKKEPQPGIERAPEPRPVAPEKKVGKVRGDEVGKVRGEEPAKTGDGKSGDAKSKTDYGEAPTP